MAGRERPSEPPQPEGLTDQPVQAVRQHSSLRLRLALIYADRLAPVFPLSTGTKVPLSDEALGFTDGFKSATTDHTLIVNAWTKYPAANIGLACHRGFSALDIDRHGDVDGFKTAADLLGAEFIEGPCAVTSGGGAHVYYSGVPGDLGCKTGFAPGLDFKTVGGYVVAPGSTLPDGTAWSWETPPYGWEPLPAMPAKLIAAIRNSTQAAPVPMSPASRITPRRSNSDAWNQRVRNACAQITGAPAGTRNVTLHRLAVSVFAAAREFGHSEDEARGYLYGAGLRSGLADSEVRATITSALNSMIVGAA